MSKTPVLLDDDQWARVLGALQNSDDAAVADCRDAIAAQVRNERDGLDTDTAFELLSDPVRRELLWTCRERDEISVDELADSVASEVTPDREELLITLHHTHLPKLESAGVVTVESDTVRYGGDELLDCLVAVDQ